MGPKMSVNFVRYSHEFVITVIVITEFDCIILKYFLSIIVSKFIIGSLDELMLFRESWPFLIF